MGRTYRRDVNDVAGWVLVGIAVLVFAYIVPAVVRSRQVVVDSRVDDRYSDDLRIVATAGHRPVVVTGGGRAFVHPRQHVQERAMASIDVQLDAASARHLASMRAARVAAASRRAAAARRRLLMTVVLAVAAAGGWAGYALASWSIAAAIGATAVLAVVVVLGRRAAAAGAAAEERWAQQIEIATKRDRRGAPSRARQEARLRVDIDPAALTASPSAMAVKVASADDEAGWTPIPVPPPAYTLKQAVPRRQISREVMEAETETLDAVGEPAAPSSAASQATDEAADAGSSFDVQAVLARRRAVG